MISRPRTLMVRLSAGLNGAKLMAIRIRLKSSAGFLPVSVSNSFSIAWMLSAFHSLRSVSLAMVNLSNSSTSASESFLTNLLLINVSISMRGSSKK